MRPETAAEMALPATTLPLRATPPTRSRLQGAVLVVFAFLPASVLPIGWFWSTQAIDIRTATGLAVAALVATVIWAARAFWLPSSTSIIIDDDHADIPVGRGRVRIHLDEVLSVRVIKGDVVVFAAVGAGVTARGHSGAVVVPRRCFVPPADGQVLVDDLRLRIGRRYDGDARLARLDAVAAAQASYAKKRPLATWIVSAACTAVFVVEASEARFFDLLVTTGGNLSTAVLHGEVWRLVTANLLHASWLHLAMNLAGLMGTGALLERWLGRWSMVLVLFFSGVGGQLASTMVALVNSAPRTTIGISGAIFGLLGVLLVSTLRFRRSPLGGMRVPLGGWMILLLTNGAISLIPVVDIVAHVGGFVAGAVVGLVVVPRPGKPLALPVQTARTAAVVAIAVTVAAVVCAVFAVAR